MAKIIWSFLLSASLQAAPYNFGVVVNNDEFQIYRSAHLSEKRLEKLSQYLAAQSLPFPKTIVHMNLHGYGGFFGTYAVDEYEGQSKYGYTFHHPYGPTRTYVDGHNPLYADKDIDNSCEWSDRADEYFDRGDSNVDGTFRDFLRVLSIVLDPANQPVLFHCHSGRHRTGMVALAIRYIQGGDWLDGPKRLKFWYWLNPAQLEYYSYNRILFRRENLTFVNLFKLSPEFEEFRREYQDRLNAP